MGERLESNFRGENFGEDEIFVSVRKRNFNFGEKMFQTRFGRRSSKCLILENTPAIFCAILTSKSSKELLTFGAGCGSIIDTRDQPSGEVPSALVRCVL